jgi:hypothetical protein
VQGIVHGDLGDAVLISQLDGVASAASFGAFCGLLGRVAAGLIGFGNEGVVVFARNDEKFDMSGGW